MFWRKNPIMEKFRKLKKDIEFTNEWLLKIKTRILSCEILSEEEVIIEQQIARIQKIIDDVDKIAYI